MKGRVAFVTGASRGIGAAIAREFQARGASVIAPARAELDLASPASVEAFLATCSSPVDILVNNAGINLLAGVDEIASETWQKMVNVNLTAPILLTRAFAPGMRARGWGRILNIGSVFGLVTKERRGTYSATKAGLGGFTRTSAVELAPSGVLVNVLCPGYVETELTRKNNSPEDLEKIKANIPARRLAQPEEIARLAAFLCSDENSYITGQEIVADGGFTIR